MKKMNLALGMMGGSLITYICMNKKLRKSAKKKIDCMFNTVEQVLGD